jgi:hypothetical protein
MGRLNLMLQDTARHVADIAVLYPITTLQGSNHLDGPLGYYQGGVAIPEADYIDVGELLSTDLSRDYTWLHPDVLDGRCSIIGNTLELNNTVNHESYKVLIVPGHQTIRWSNLQKIKQFYDNGGKVIATGTLPSKSAEFDHDADVVTTINQLFPDAAGISVTASSEWGAGGYEPGKAVDGSIDTRWNAADNSGGNQWLQIDFGKARTFNRTVTREAFERVTSYAIQYWNGSEWRTCANGTSIGSAKTDSFATVTASKVRLFINTISSASASIWEFEVYLNDGPNLVTNDSLSIISNEKGGNAVLITSPAAGTMRTALDRMVPVYDVEFENNLALRYIHKVKDSLNIYFFANTSGQSIETFARLRNGGTPQALDPHTGTIAIPEYTLLKDAGQDVTRVRLNLPPFHAMFIVSKEMSVGVSRGIQSKATGLECFHSTYRSGHGFAISYIVAGGDQQRIFVNLSIFDLKGRRVAELINQSVSTGVHSLTWSTLNTAHGTYIVRLNMGGQKLVKKAVVF